MSDTSALHESDPVAADVTLLMATPSSTLRRLPESYSWISEITSESAAEGVQASRLA